MSFPSGNVSIASFARIMFFVIITAGSVLTVRGSVSGENVDLVSLLGRDADTVYARLGAPGHTSHDTYPQGFGLPDRTVYAIVHLYQMKDMSRLAIVFDEESERVVAIAYDSFGKRQLSDLGSFTSDLRLQIEPGPSDDGGFLTSHPGMLARRYDTVVNGKRAKFFVLIQLLPSDVRYDALNNERNYRIPDDPRSRGVYSWLLTTMCGLDLLPERVFMSDTERSEDERFLSSGKEAPLRKDAPAFGAEFGRRLHMDDADGVFNAPCM